MHVGLPLPHWVAMSNANSHQELHKPASSNVSLPQLRRGFGPIYRKLSRCGSELSIAERMVLINLLERLGQNGKAWPSRQRMADDLGISTKSVDRAVARLVANGWISTVRRGLGQPNDYYVDVARLLSWAERPIQKGQTDHSEEDAVTPEEPAVKDLKVRTTTTVATAVAGGGLRKEVETTRRRYDARHITEKAVAITGNALPKTAASQLLTELLKRHPRDEAREILEYLPAWLTIVDARLDRKHLADPNERARYLSGALKNFRFETERDVTRSEGGSLMGW